MKEITCICGEKVVFLDPEVEVKACPNCGMQVYQHGAPVNDIVVFKKKKRRNPLGRRGVYVLAVLCLVLAAFVAALAVASVRKSALEKAADAVTTAQAAEKRGDLQYATAAYRRALDTYELWNAPDEVWKPVQAALGRVRASLAQARADGKASAQTALVAVSLEEIARQAYTSVQEGFVATFDRDYAGKNAFLRGKVEERTGVPYRDSALTISYRVFSPSGEPVEVCFDGPFFERYRLAAGKECIVQAVLTRAYLDPGGPGESGRWVVVLGGRSSSLVTDTATLKGLGWRIDDEIENLVSSQRSLSPAF